MVKPTTCCGKGEEDCVCQQQSRCSCGKNKSQHCDCEKKAEENTVAGPRCSCRMPFRPPCSIRCKLTTFLGARPAGACNCDRASEENQKVVGEVCQCGVRPAGMWYIPDRPDQGLTYLKGVATVRKLRTAGFYRAKPTLLPRLRSLRRRRGEMIDAWKALAVGDGFAARTWIACILDTTNGGTRPSWHAQNSAKLQHNTYESRLKA